MELKLLIVEDDRLLAEAVSDYFTGKGWKTDVVYNGNSALEKNERVVDNHIKKLRKALASSRCRIHTVRKSGYRMEVSV